MVSLASEACGSRGCRTVLWSGGFCGQQLRYGAVPVVGTQSLSPYAYPVQATDGLVAAGHSPVLRGPARSTSNASILEISEW